MVEVGMVSLDGVAPSLRVGVSASVNLPLHHKVQKFSSGTVSPGWTQKKNHKTVVVWCTSNNSISPRLHFLQNAIINQQYYTSIQCLLCYSISWHF